MESERVISTVARRSASIYIPITLGASLLFTVAAGLTGPYTPVAIVGGVVWVGLLSLIVSMPIVTSYVKKTDRRSEDGIS